MTNTLTRRADQAADLARRLRKLADYAAAGGAPEEWLLETYAALTRERMGHADPRRRHTLELAALIGRAADAGATTEQLADRFGCTPSWIRRLRGLDRAHRTSGARFAVQPGTMPKRKTS
jgi:hypothetical protein